MKVSNSLWTHGLYSPWNSPGQNTGVDRQSLLQGIFPTQGSNPGLLHCRWILYQLSHKGSPGILEWVAYPFPSGSSWPRNRTGVSWIAGGFFTSWATRESKGYNIKQMKMYNVSPFSQNKVRSPSQCLTKPFTVCSFHSHPELPYSPVEIPLKAVTFLAVTQLFSSSSL